MKVGIAVLAGGEGNRFGSKKPKQLVKIHGKPMFIWSLLVPLSLNANHTILVFNKNWMDEAIMELKKERIHDKVEVIDGGRTRQLSAWKALRYLEKYNVDIILIHDANRPFASIDLYKRILNELVNYDSCIPIIKPRDSIYEMYGDIALRTRNRETLGLIQTPQGFKYSLIHSFHEKAYEKGWCNFPDDSSILIHFGYPIHVIEGELTNLKITFKEDMEFAKHFISSFVELNTTTDCNT